MHPKPARSFDAPSFDISCPRGALLPILIVFQCRVLFWLLLCPTLAVTSADITLMPWETCLLARDFQCSHQPRWDGRALRKCSTIITTCLLHHCSAASHLIPSSAKYSHSPSFSMLHLLIGSIDFNYVEEDGALKSGIEKTQT